MCICTYILLLPCRMRFDQQFILFFSGKQNKLPTWEMFVRDSVHPLNQVQVYQLYEYKHFYKFVQAFVTSRILDGGSLHLPRSAVSFRKSYPTITHYTLGWNGPVVILVSPPLPTGIKWSCVNISVYQYIYMWAPWPECTGGVYDVQWVSRWSRPCTTRRFKEYNELHQQQMKYILYCSWEKTEYTSSASPYMVRQDEFFGFFFLFDTMAMNWTDCVLVLSLCNMHNSGAIKYCHVTELPLLDTAIWYTNLRSLWYGQCGVPSELKWA